LWQSEWHDQSTRINSMGWFEYGLHYAKIISTNRSRQWKAGATLNFLQGIGAIYAKNTNLNYKVIDSATVRVNASSLDYGLTKYDTGVNVPSYRDLNHGAGISGNVGVTYTVLKDPEHCGNQSNTELWNSEDARQYVLRLGFSLIDLGTIKYNRNTRAYHYETTGTTYTTKSDSAVSHSGLNPNLQGLASATDTNRVVTADHFNMVLPAAIRLQADWQFRKDFFLNLTIIKGIGHGNSTGITRPDSYSITPRYETSWFEASMPISVIYYGRWQPRIGLAFRIGYFYFGGDAPGSLFGLTDFERTDFYAGIHIFPLKINRKNKSIKCPDGVNNK
ncbi:MAG TPA: DUF5723 family protein, partial [Puia sp.]|nr:DUF5723 family protein [Puia sp.]